jgi:CHAT domain-containing protein
MLVERGVRRATTEDDGAHHVGDPHLARDGKPADAAPFDRVTWRSALAGNADALDHLPPLPGSRFEVLRLAALLPHPRVLLGAAASESALVELARSGQLSRFRILHVASHALVDDRAPDRSAVVLSRVGLPDALAAALRGERAYDGLWTAKEIVRECRLDADLVTLSGCRTGLGREAAGEGYLGLAHALFQAGARCLLVSLWAVDDRASALLMERFYTNLLGGERSDGTSVRPASSKAEALRDAREWLRTYVDETGARPFEHPAYWAPFILIGDSR